MDTQKNRKTKIVLTGGHGATTAYALVEEIKSEGLGWKLYWIGARYAVEGKKVLTLEYEVLPKAGVTFLPLIMGRLQRRFTVWTIPALLKIPVGFVQSFYYLGEVRPKVVLSFGGYSAFPVVFAAKMLGIPVVLHEQTAAAGRANLVSAKFADKIALAREESLKYFPKEKAVVIGNPAIKETFSVKRKTASGVPPTILVSGGSRGSQNINNVIADALPIILAKYKLIHQTGELDIDKFVLLRDSLPPDMRKNYEVFSRVDPVAIAGFYEKADIIVARSGANTASDIMAAGRPAILIPLPISYLDEQTKNARVLEKMGIATIINQKELTSDRLLKEIERTLAGYRTITENIRKIESPDRTAAAKLVNLISNYLK